MQQQKIDLGKTVRVMQTYDIVALEHETGTPLANKVGRVIGITPNGRVTVRIDHVDHVLPPSSLMLWTMANE